MFDAKGYKGPFKVVIRADGSDRDTVAGPGLDAEDAEAVAAWWAVKPHVALVTVQDEPTSHTVAIIYDRDKQERVEDTREQFDANA